MTGDITAFLAANVLARLEKAELQRASEAGASAVEKDGLTHTDDAWERDLNVRVLAALRALCGKMEPELVLEKSEPLMGVPQTPYRPQFGQPAKTEADLRAKLAEFARKP